MRKFIISFLALLILAFPAIAAVVTSATVPTTRTTGTTITAAIWNNDVQGIYTYLNNNIVAVLNVLTTKGDLYIYDGAALQRLGVGPDGQVLTADSTTATGAKWAAFANNTQLTTKGDLLTYSGAATRLGVGSNNQVLIADSTQATGLKWGTPPAGIPTGTIVAWSPSAAGTNTIPTGWLLCDGTSSTPNLIGKFIIGTRPSTSSSTANASGYGYYAADGNGGGSTTHTHTATVSGNTGTPSATVGATSAGGSYGNSDANHTHSVSISASSSSASTEPADYALVYIMKQ